MGHNLKVQRVLDAMNMAIGQRKPTAVIHHSSQGSQYTSVAFGLRCKEAGVRPSMGSVGDAYDNAMCESFFATLECELLDRRKFQTKAEARMAIFEFIEGWYNPGRRHSALDMACPAERYTPSSRAYNGLPELEYPFHDRDVLVTACGRICVHRKKINISTIMAGQRVGIKEVDDGIWLVSFMIYDLGYIDLEQRTLQTIDNPFGNRLSPMS